jgi:general stress protein YciG
MPNRNQTSTPGSGRGNRGGRGFASMDEDRQREIASKGGRAAHKSGNAHEFDAEEAREAGRRGGLVRSENRASSLGIGLDDGQGVTHLQDLDQEPGSSRMRERGNGLEESAGAQDRSDQRHRGTQVRGRETGDKPSTRTPGRDDGRSGHKEDGSMRASGKQRTDANDENTRSGRGKHH